MDIERSCGAMPAPLRVVAAVIAMIMATPTAFVQHIRSGRLKAIAATSAQRFPTMPEVPTAMAKEVAREP